MNRVRILMSALLTSLPFGAIAAQVAPGPRDAYVLEQRVGERWLHTAQHPLFAPFRDTRTFLSLSPQPGSAAGVLSFRARPETGSRVSMVLEVRFSVTADGRISEVDALTRPPIFTAVTTAADSMQRITAAFYESVPMRWFSMPESRVWEVVPVVRASELRRGARWTDTLAFSAVANDHSQTLAGIRTSVVTGDTTIDGNRLWIISDSSDATVTERYYDTETSLREQVRIERRARGSIRGRHFYDPTLRLFRFRFDTTALSGTATVRYADGRSFTTPVRLERRRDFTLHTLVAFNARLEALATNPELLTDQTSSAISLQSVLAERLRAGEQKATDSIFSLWNASRDPLDRWRIMSSGSAYSGRVGGPALAAKINAAQLAAGDSTAFAAGMLNRPREWTVATVRDLLIPTLGDPQGALSRGQRPDAFYNSMMRYLIETPPAITRDTASWAVSPAVHDFLAQYGRSASDARLKDVGLLSLFVREPARWADSVRARARAGSAIVTEAALLVDGATAYAEGTALPQSGADWRAWHFWIIGPTPPPGVPGRPPRPRAMNFSVAHSRAIKMFEMRTGRPVVAELQRDLAAVTSDSARLIYSTILQGLGALSAGPEQLAERFRSGLPSDLAIGRTALTDLFRRAGVSARGGGPPGAVPSPIAVENSGVTVADSVIAAMILGRVIEAMTQPGRALQTLEQKLNLTSAAPAVRLPPMGNAAVTVIDVANIPAATVEQWRPRIGFISAGDFRPQDPAELRQFVSFQSVMRAGPFLLVRVGWTVFYNSARGGRSGGGGSTTLYLLEVNGEWVVVHGSTIVA